MVYAIRKIIVYIRKSNIRSEDKVFRIDLSIENRIDQLPVWRLMYISDSGCNLRVVYCSNLSETSRSHIS